MPRAMFRIQGGSPLRETSFATPKRVGNIDSWWKACRKTWPDLPEVYTSVKISTDKITFVFPYSIFTEASETIRVGKVYIDRTYKFGS